MVVPVASLVAIAAAAAAAARVVVHLFVVFVCFPIIALLFTMLVIVNFSGDFFFRYYEFQYCRSVEAS